VQITKSWTTGFVDGDGCFNTQKVVTKENKVKIRHPFIVSQDKRSVEVLYALKERLKSGTVHKAGNNMMAFTVTKRESIEKIVIPFLIKNPLQTEKRKDFYKWVESVTNWTHFSKQEEEGFSYSINDQWFAGFVDAEGCFYVSIVKKYPRPQLMIGAPEKERGLLLFLQKYLQTGQIIVRKDNFIIFQVTSCKNLETKIFSRLFTKSNKNKLKTIKRISLLFFRKIVKKILQKEHIEGGKPSVKGMGKISKLKGVLNKYCKE
jgi:hypothetical protein